MRKRIPGHIIFQSSIYFFLLHSSYLSYSSILHLLSIPLSFCFSLSLSLSIPLSIYLSIYLSNPLSFSFLSLFLFYPSEPTSTSFPIGMMNGRGKASGPDQTLDQESQMRLAKLKSEDEEMDKGLDDISHTIDNLTNIAGDMNAEVSIYESINITIYPYLHLSLY